MSTGTQASHKRAMDRPRLGRVGSVYSFNALTWISRFASLWGTTIGKTKGSSSVEAPTPGATASPLSREAAGIWTLCVLNTHPGSSRHEPVLVDEAADDFFSWSKRRVRMLHPIHCEAQILGAR